MFSAFVCLFGWEVGGGVGLGPAYSISLVLYFDKAFEITVIKCDSINSDKRCNILSIESSQRAQGPGQIKYH